MHNLVESDANRIISRLHIEGIHGEKQRQPDGKWSILVEQDQAARSLRKLENARYLKDKPELRKESSLVTSREEQRFRYERALSFEIEQTLTTVQGVLDARVHLNLPLRDPLFGEPLNKAEGSASVYLVTERDFSFSHTQIAELVSGAAGVESSRVAVLLSAELRDVELSTSNTPQTVEQISSEAPFVQRIHMTLMNIPDTVLLGSGGVILLILGVRILFRLHRGEATARLTNPIHNFSVSPHGK